MNWRFHFPWLTVAVVALCLSGFYRSWLFLVVVAVCLLAVVLQLSEFNPHPAPKMEAQMEAPAEPPAASANLSAPPAKEPPAIAPDCRAQKVFAVEEFAHCLMAKARACQHSLDFGGDRLCFHPGRKLIITQTLPEPRAQNGAEPNRLETAG